MRFIVFFWVLLSLAPALAQTIDTPPKLVHEAAVEYPPRALVEQREASVLLEVDIDTNGAVTRAEVVEPSDAPDYGFEAAAQEVVRKFEFEPARASGTPVAVRVRYLYRFVPPPAPTPSPPETGPSAPQVASGRDTGTAPAPAQRTDLGELVGQVLERGKRSLLAGVTVVASRGEEAYEALTDEQGRFAFYDLAPGGWVLAAQSDGYLESRREEQVAAREQTDVTLYLERTADNPYDVLVEADAPRREVTRHKLDARDAATQPGSFGDPLLAVQNLPGVAVSAVDTTNGGIAMRGAAPDESATYLDGFRMPLLFHFIPLRSLIAPGMLESLEVYPGGAPVYYGRQIGGVIEAKLKRLAPDRTHGYLDVSLLDSGLYVETPIGKRVAVAGAVRFSYIDRIINPLGGSLPRYDDYQFQVVARPSAAHQLRLLVIGSDDVLRMPTKDLRDEDAQITFGTIAAGAHMQHVALSHDFTPSSEVANHLRVGYLRWRTFSHFGDAGRVDIGYDAMLLRDTLRLTPTSWLAMELGADAELGRWTTDVLVSPPEKEGQTGAYVDYDKEKRAHTGNIPQYAAGTFAEVQLKPHRDLLIVPGVRADLQPQVATITADPRITVRYQLFRRLALKAGTGIHHGAPLIDESAKRFGNPHLGAERSVQHSAGVEVTPIDSLVVQATGFYHQLDGLAARSDRLRVSGDQVVQLNYENTGEGRAYGLEIMAKKELSHRLSGFVAYTLSRSERRRVHADSYRLFDNDQTHSVVLVAAYQLPRHFQLSTRFRYRTGQPNTPIVSASFVSDDDVYAPVFGKTNSSRNASFQQLDVRIDKAWVFDRWSFTAYLDVQNVYNHNNSTSLAYNYDYSQRGKVRSVPILPILGLKAEY